MRTFSKLRVDGDSLVITVPKSWIDFHELEAGDTIEWEVLNTKKHTEGE